MNKIFERSFFIIICLRMVEYIIHSKQSIDSFAFTHCQFCFYCVEGIPCDIHRSLLPRMPQTHQSADISHHGSFSIPYKSHRSVSVLILFSVKCTCGKTLLRTWRVWDPRWEMIDLISADWWDLYVSYPVPFFCLSWILMDILVGDIALFAHCCIVQWAWMHWCHLRMLSPTSRHSLLCKYTIRKIAWENAKNWCETLESVQIRTSSFAHSFTHSI